MYLIKVFIYHIKYNYVILEVSILLEEWQQYSKISLINSGGAMFINNFTVNIEALHREIVRFFTEDLSMEELHLEVLLQITIMPVLVQVQSVSSDNY